MTTQIAKIKIVDKLKPVFAGEALTRCAWGGRGSGKTRSFATMAALKGYEYGNLGIKGIILCARQFQNSLAESSLVELKRSIEDCPILADYYEIGEKYIKSKDGNIRFQFVGLDRNVHSIKSMGEILVCWVDEAQTVTAYAWDILIPTLRSENKAEFDEEGNPLPKWQSELWVTWNPLHKNCPVEQRFRFSDDPDLKKVEINWQDNALFPAVLNKRRERDLIERPDHYGHIWEGEYATAVEGAYYAKHMLDAKHQNRITDLHVDPLMDIRAFWDIGGTGKHSDATAIWFAQFINQKINVIDFYQAQGQDLGTHIQWIRQNGYDKALMVLPHDGAAHDKVHNVSFESALIAAGFRVHVVPNQGSGAVKNRIEVTRRLFPQIWFDEERTKEGREALCWYHEKRIECEGHFIGMGANHDWSSHAADAFGLMCIAYEEPSLNGSHIISKIFRENKQKKWYNSWMAV